MNLLAICLDVCIALLDPLLSVIQVEEGVVLVFLPFKQWLLGPGGHDLLDLLNVVLGFLNSYLKVMHLVTGLLNVVPHTWIHDRVTCQEQTCKSCITVHNSFGSSGKVRLVSQMELEYVHRLHNSLHRA